MLKKLISTFLYLGSIVLVLIFVVSCEEDFTDIGTTIVSNDEFTTNDTLIEITVTGENIERVRADGLSLSGGALGQYLLGVYNNPNYEKIEASIISQLTRPLDLTIVDEEYGNDTIVVTTIDTVFLRLPYQATRIGTDNIGPDFQLDSIFGDQTVPFTMNVFRSTTYLNTLNPQNPAENNQFFSDDVYEVDPEKLNVFEDIQFTPNKRDTAQFVLRRLSTGDIYGTDTIRYPSSNPYINIPLKKNRIKEILFDQYDSPDFTSQDAFNNYFRGLKIQAEGNEGSIVSLNLTSTTFQPRMDIFYTNTLLTNGGSVVIDTIAKTDTFFLSGIRNSIYQMTNGPVPPVNKFAIQGTAGNMAIVDILTSDQLSLLQSKDWLINDATLTLYVDKTTVGSDTINTPFRLFVYKDEIDGGQRVRTQILDALSEGILALDGFLTLDDNGAPDKYNFKITDYISELVSGDRDDARTLGIKLYNPTDLYDNFRDTLIDTHSWNPKAVMLLNHDLINGERRARLKISYSEKTLEGN